MSHIRTRLQNDFLWLILDRPPLNILSLEMLVDLRTALRGALAREPRLVVLMGAGEGAFSAGCDAREQQDGQVREVLQVAAEISACFEDLRERGIGSVALVKGAALGGGCELAALCDTVLAHEQATFGLPEIGLGIFPPIAAACFPRILGTQTTMRLLLTGEIISAREALRVGLAHQVLPQQRFLLDAEELLVMLASLQQLTRA